MFEYILFYMLLCLSLSGGWCGFTIDHYQLLLLYKISAHANGEICKVPNFCIGCGILIFLSLGALCQVSEPWDNFSKYPLFNPKNALWGWGGFWFFFGLVSKYLCYFGAHAKCKKLYLDATPIHLQLKMLWMTRLIAEQWLGECLIDLMFLSVH